MADDKRFPITKADLDEIVRALGEGVTEGTPTGQVLQGGVLECRRLVGKTLKGQVLESRRLYAPRLQYTATEIEEESDGSARHYQGSRKRKE